MIPLKTAMEGVLSFAANDVLPSMPNGLKKFAAYMALGALKTNPEPAVRPYMPFLKMTGVLSEDGSTVDEQKMAVAFSDAFANVPNVDFLGFTFTAEDANKLITRISKGA